MTGVSILNPLGTLFFFVLLSLIFKRERLATILLVLFFILLAALEGGNFNLSRLPFILINTLLFIFVLMRFGLLATIATQFFRLLFFIFPSALGFSAWYAQSSNLVILIGIAVVTYAFYTSLAGQKLFRENLPGD